MGFIMQVTVDHILTVYMCFCIFYLDKLCLDSSSACQMFRRVNEIGAKPES